MPIEVCIPLTSGHVIQVVKEKITISMHIKIGKVFVRNCLWELCHL